MNILLVDNNTKHTKALQSALFGYDIETQLYNPKIKFNTEGKDLIVLSGGGGQGSEINDIDYRGDLWYKNEIDFVRTCQTPIIGICMGFEVICRAFGEKVEEMRDVVMGFQKLHTTKQGQSIFGEDSLKQYEAHKWRVKNVLPDEFNVLANSDTGVEIISHKRRPIMATQFHPEKGGTISLPQLVSYL